MAWPFVRYEGWEARKAAFAARWRKTPGTSGKGSQGPAMTRKRGKNGVGQRQTLAGKR